MPLTVTNKYPLVNGQIVSWAELRLALDLPNLSFRTADFQSVAWDHGLEAGEAMGEGPAPVGHTEGIYKIGSAKFGLLKDAGRRLRLALASVDPAYGTVQFTFSGSWRQRGGGVIHTFEWRGARLSKESLDAKTGSADPMITECECKVLRIFEDGVCPVGDA